ncbi:MAG: DUF1538 domain-containing protein [Gammaproteobacteria bacterium]|nr:DUF1538 domain-containing protein [Gammaproteobacteria bacterium]
MELVTTLFGAILGTVKDVLPIAAIVVGFQIFVIRRPVANVRRLIIGFLYVIAGLGLFLAGLERSLFPLGELLARELTDPAFLGAGPAALWKDYYWVYIFAAAIGFTTTIAEPALIAVAIKAREVSAGGVSVWGLRIAVALGVATGVALGTFRIITGTALHHYIIAGYVVVIIQTVFAQKSIIPLAYDSGGVTTSTVTVPVVTALGLGLANTVPGRNPLVDGFGLIAFASVFPIMAVLAYAQLAKWLMAFQARPRTKGE